MNTGIADDCGIFYIDDDKDDLSLFKEAIYAIGETACVFDLPDMMLHALKNPPPNPKIIFVDLNMPHKTGFEIMEEIKTVPNLRHLPVVAYSTASDPRSIKKCRELGMSFFVTKPRSFNAIQKAIKTVLEINWAEHKITDETFVYRP